MSSHPGSTLRDAVELAVYLHENGCIPEQVQDFYPTPGTASTVMYYTGIDPMTGKPVPVTDDPHRKQLQRALLQYNRPENAALVREALRAVGREELIGYGRECLVRPESAGKMRGDGANRSRPDKTADGAAKNSAKHVQNKKTSGKNSSGKKSSGKKSSGGGSYKSRVRGKAGQRDGMKSTGDSRYGVDGKKYGEEVRPDEKNRPTSEKGRDGRASSRRRKG